jgi:hypothetical protein
MNDMETSIPYKAVGIAVHIEKSQSTGEIMLINFGLNPSA